MSINKDRLVAFEDINDKYAWAYYGQFKLIMMKENGYVNATKMCDDSNKKIFHWKENKRSKNLINYLKQSNYIGIPIDPIVTITTCENDLRGTYVHTDLVLDIASWISEEFYFKTSKIVTEYHNRESREKLEKLHRIALVSHQAEINKLESEKSELQIIREKLEKEFERADEERKRADEERKRAELRYIEMCKKYDIQYDNIVELKDINTELKEDIGLLNDNIVELKEDIGLLNDNVNILKEDVNIHLSNQNDLIESSKTQNDMLEYIIEENNELKDEMTVVKEKITDVQVKLGISVEDRVPKTEKKSKSETFILLEKEDYVVGEDDDEYQYQAVCGQIGYSNSKAKKLIREENYKEILKIEYTPNTKNLLNRLKEQKLKITFQYNKFNTNIARETLIDHIRKIDCDKRNV